MLLDNRDNPVVRFMSSLQQACHVDLLFSDWAQWCIDISWLQSPSPCMAGHYVSSKNALLFMLPTCLNALPLQLNWDILHKGVNVKVLSGYILGKS